ncbi:hypothetical protein [Calothrix sp. CCY 0018]|uniref:hypothetical protein n=1 Tax=Calothrix sp. CCY 0018 TaxID=3103864 RepID=UPI0039C5FF75
MSLISLDLIHELVELNNLIINEQIIHPTRLALKLEEIAARAWEEARELGVISFEEAEGL